MLKVWNICLISGAFALSIFGTFLTRSGILSSIHAFVSTNIGWYFVFALVAIIGGAFVLILWRLPLLKADQRIESLVSREATFLFNNLLLVGIAFAVLWGVIFPLVTEAFGSVRETVSTPFYEFFVIVFGLPLLLLMGIGPLIAWRRASLKQLQRSFLYPLVGYGLERLRVCDRHDPQRVCPRCGSPSQHPRRKLAARPVALDWSQSAAVWRLHRASRRDLVCDRSGRNIFDRSWSLRRNRTQCGCLSK